LQPGTAKTVKEGQTPRKARALFID
jgi:hypothetical protein